MRSGLGSRRLSYLRRSAIASTVLVALVATAALAASAQAAIYTVGTHSDTARGLSCEDPASGACSLRQLIEYENALEPTPTTPDVILVPSGRYELIYGTITITQSLVIEGAGARTTSVDISPDGYQERVFSAQSPGESAIGIIGLEIAGGTAAADEGYGEFGGDIRNKGSLLLGEDWITEGTASVGGGIANVAGTLVLERSLVSDNHATTGSGEGGGIQNYGFANCDGSCSPGQKAVLAIEDSTVAENNATVGAGIYSLAEDGVADENGVSIINSTIAYNSTSPCIGCIGAGAGLRTTDGTIDVVGSIVAYNSETNGGKIAYINCSASPPAKIVSLGYNLETGTDCGFESTGDLQGTSPDFSSSTPQNNGGNTDTLAPEPTSPVVDAIPTSWSFCDGIDQRGVIRPQGAGCDIGAVELGGAVTPTPIPTPTPTPTPSPAPPTLVTTSTPAVITTTSAAFTATVNPQGLATEVHFEYGLVLGGAKAAAITYGSVTPDQSVGPDFANHTITAMVTGLLPNVTYNVRAVATNSAGSAVGANQTLVTPADPPPPPPVLGKSVNVTPVSGVVYIELPPGANLAAVSPFSSGSLGVQAFAALAKGRRFIPLTEARQIPVGSVLETTGGVARIATATSKPKEQQFGNFGGGIFKLLQNRKQKGLTDLDIVDNHSAGQVCATVGKKGKALAAKLSSKTLGRVNASGHGHFAVHGQYSAATVRGTVWSVANRCEGTLTHVTRGVVSVRDFRRRKTITLFTGESYLAKAPHH
jgi:hypothetical protein